LNTAKAAQAEARVKNELTDLEVKVCEGDPTLPKCIKNP
jgi:hypothetical protein